MIALMHKKVCLFAHPLDRFLDIYWSLSGILASIS